MTGPADLQQSARLAKVRGALWCPACRADLVDTPSSLCCSSCSADYPVRNGKIYFIETPDATDELDIVKYRLKQILGKAYCAVGITVFAPTFPFNDRAAVLRFADPDKQLVIDIGAGNHRIDPRTEVLAVIFSFGNERPEAFLYLIFCLVFFRSNFSIFRL
ncbi:MAG: hypothetical protein NTAFB05_05640 [Nitrobacter sp.]